MRTLLSGLGAWRGPSFSQAHRLRICETLVLVAWQMGLPDEDQVETGMNHCGCGPNEDGVAIKLAGGHWRTLDNALTGESWRSLKVQHLCNLQPAICTPLTPKAPARRLPANNAQSRMITRHPKPK